MTQLSPRFRSVRLCFGLVMVLVALSPAATAQWEHLGLGGDTVRTLELVGEDLFASTVNGVYLLNLSDSDTTWQYLGFEEFDIRALVALSADTILASVKPGPPNLYRTEDGGLSWLPSDSGFAEGYHSVRQLVSYPGQSDTIFAGYDNYSIARSFDGGRSWQTSTDDLPWTHFLAVDPNDGHTVYAGGETWFFQPWLARSSDHCETWDILFDGFVSDNRVHDIAFLPANSDNSWVSMEGQVRKTTDGWQSWTIVLSPPGYCYGIEIDRLRPNNLYVTGARWYSPQSLFVSHDGGSVWDTLTESSPPDTTYPQDLVLVSEPTRNICYIATNKGVYSYTDVIPFVCGDIDGDTLPINIADLVYLVDYMFTGGPAPPNPATANIDGLNGIDISDLVYLVDYMFTGGDEPLCNPTL